MKITDNTGGFSVTLADDDQFGASIANIGDLDDDGVDDLAVGARFDDTGGNLRGAIYVLFMNSDGTVKGNQKIASGTGGFGALGNGDRFGTGVAGIGDLNNDGVEDIAVGATTDDTGGSNRGALYVLFMNTNGTVSSQVMIADNTNGMGTLVDQDLFGTAIEGIGDLDGDTVEDLIVGAPGDDTGGSARGAAYVLLMNTDGTAKSNHKIADNTGGFGVTLADTDNFGDAVTVIGDLDGDGVLDLAVGTPFNDTGGNANQGLYVLFMNAAGTVKSSVRLGHNDGGIGSLVSLSKFGSALRGIGDLDGDGVRDLAVGASNYTAGAGNAPGAFYYVLMNSDGTAKHASVVGHNTGGFGALTHDDNLGDGLARLSDLDGDGIDELVVGAGGDDTGGSNRGAIYVLFTNRVITTDSSQANPQGVSVRIASPDSGSVVKIGGKVDVKVFNLPGVTAADTVIVGLSTSNDVLDFGNLGYRDTLFTKTSSSASVDTFTVSFTVAAGDTQFTTPTGIAVARLQLGGVLKQTDSQSMLNAIQSDASFGLVGDQKTFGIDGRRPLRTAFDSVMVDTGGLTNSGGTIFGTRATTDGADGASQLVRSFKVGDEVKVKTHVKESSFDITDIDSVKVYLVDMATSGYAVPDSSFYTMSYSATSFLSNSGVMRDSFTVTEGMFSSNAVKDNMRIGALGFFKDRAGNLSAATASASSAAAFSLDVYTVADTRLPVVTPVLPKAAGDRFTGLKDSSMVVLKIDGTKAAATLKMSPLSLKTDESTLAIRAIVGADTAVYAGGNKSDTLTFATTDSFTTPKGRTSGALIDLTLSVTDSVGNTGKTTVSGVTLDQVAPALQDLFPSAALLDTTIITNQTRHPRFELLESVDTVGVRFVQTTTSSPHLVEQAVASADSGLVVVTVVDTLKQDVQYAYQVFTRDLAGNVFLGAIDTLRFDDSFANPSADSFVVTLDSAKTKVDSVIAGVNLPIKLTAIDTALTNAKGKLRPAVTFNSESVRVRVVSLDTSLTEAGTTREERVQDISGVRFAGTGVTDNGDGSATLNSDGWSIGTRTILVKSEKTLDEFAVVVERDSTTGRLGSLTVDAGEFRTFNVSVVEEGGDAARAVGGNFSVFIEAADGFGNPSMKVFNGNTNVSNADSLIASTNLLDSRVPAGNVLGSVWIELASNSGEVSVPQGPQKVESVGRAFRIRGSDRTVIEGLIISARSVGATSDTSGSTLPRAVARGASPPLDHFPEAIDYITRLLQSPDTLIVQDYLGANGKGDQGGYVVVAFKRVEEKGISPIDSDVNHYRVYREMLVNTELDSTGTLVKLDAPVARFVPWAVIDPPPIRAVEDSLMIAVIPAIDNVETRWAIASEYGGESVEQGTPTKPTVRAVRSVLQHLGYPETNLSPLTTASTAAGIPVGWISARYDPRPEPTRQQLTKLSSTSLRISEPARAVDNVPPAPVTELVGLRNSGSFELTWELSVDDRPVGYVPYRGYAIPIPGVREYQVFAGRSVDGLELAQTVSGGTSVATLENTVNNIFQVIAVDTDNASPSPMIIVSGRDGIPSGYLNAAGEKIFIIVEDGDTPYVVDFEDFLAFAASFNQDEGSPLYNPRADADGSGSIDFNDFLGFAGSFGQVAATFNGQPVGSSGKITVRGE